MSKLREKRLEILSRLGDVQESKNGGHYVVLSSVSGNRQVIRTATSVSKNELHRLGERLDIPQTNNEIMLLTKDNKILYKASNIKRFQTLNSKVLVQLSNNYTRPIPNIIELLLYGKKCEWIKNYDHKLYRLYKFIRSFGSPKELLKFLGVTFRVNNDQITYSNIYNLITGYKFLNKRALIGVDEHYLQDVINMIESTNRQDLYKSDKNLTNLHNELVEIQNIGKIERFPDTIVAPLYMKELALHLSTKFEVESLNSERALYREGIVMKHCVGSRSYQLPNRCYFHIKYKGKDWTLECTDRINELKGYRNELPDKELTDSIKECLEEFSKRVIVTNTNTHYQPLVLNDMLFEQI